LDRLRGVFPEKRTTVICEYRRLIGDLPPLLPEDRLVGFWEVRDLLDEEHLKQLEHLAERIDNDGPGFGGLRLYTRSRGDDRAELLAQRKQQIESALGMSCGEQLVALGQ
jgi:hypothetical protein